MLERLKKPKADNRIEREYNFEIQISISRGIWFLIGTVLLIFLLIGAIKSTSVKRTTVKPIGELRINPVIQQLKNDKNSYYYRKDNSGGSYYRLN